MRMTGGAPAPPILPGQRRRRFWQWLAVRGQPGPEDVGVLMKLRWILGSQVQAKMRARRILERES